MFLELRSHEGVEVIDSQIGFGHLGKKLLVIGPCVMTGFSSPKEKDPFIQTFLFRSFVGGKDARVIESKNLIVIGMSCLLYTSPSPRD